MYVHVAAINTFVSNQVTMGPIHYFGYDAGAWTLGIPPHPFEFEMSFAWLAERLATIWQPFVLGFLLLGTVITTIGYVGLDLLWRATISDYFARRNARRKD